MSAFQQYSSAFPSFTAITAAASAVQRQPSSASTASSSQSPGTPSWTAAAYTAGQAVAGSGAAAALKSVADADADRDRPRKRAKMHDSVGSATDARACPLNGSGGAQGNGNGAARAVNGSAGAGAGQQRLRHADTASPSSAASPPPLASASAPHAAAPAPSSTPTEESPVPPSKSKDPNRKATGKRKKANRACFHCQKAHLTCDDARPCARCVKRGLGETCADGVRKKAKYLRDYDDALLAKPGATPGSFTGREEEDSANGSSSQPPLSAREPQFSFDGLESSISPNAFDIVPRSATPSSAAGLPTPQPMTNPLHLMASTAAAAAAAPLTSAPSATAATASAPFDALSLFGSNTDWGFGSEAAGYEYAILSSMLNGGGYGVELDGGAPHADSSPALRAAADADDFFGGACGDGFTPAAGGGIEAIEPCKISEALQGGPLDAVAPGEDPALEVGSVAGPTAAPIGGKVEAGDEQEGWKNGIMMTSDEVYRNVTKPYRYTDSYHFLIKHLRERFEKNDILRIVRALAIYRPSLIALQMPLTEEDEIFVEKCFQRTLIELDRLISFSGTPTVVWRRTGEISCVGQEFNLLTEWTREQLLGKKKFIYELFDTSSTVEYYEAFATHAFENTTQAVMTTCVLLTPRGRPVPCTCCFTIKRDLFNCPSLVIGSFLPILGG